MNKYNCKICSKEIGYNSAHYGSGLCKSCSLKKAMNKPEVKLKISGKNNHNYKESRTLKKYYCRMCSKEITGRGKSGLCRSCSVKGKINYFKGKKRNPFNREHRNKIGKARKGKKSSKITCSKISKTNKIILNRQEVKLLISKRMKISWNNPNSLLYKKRVRGLSVNNIRSLSEYKQWRFEVFERDDYTCQECFKRGCYLEAHHKKQFAKLFAEFLKEYDQFSPLEDKETLVRLAIKYKPFWDITNGQTLCKDCHKLETFNLITKKIKEKK